MSPKDRKCKLIDWLIAMHQTIMQQCCTPEHAAGYMVFYAHHGLPTMLRFKCKAELFLSHSSARLHACVYMIYPDRKLSCGNIHSCNALELHMVCNFCACSTSTHRLQFCPQYRSCSFCACRTSTYGIQVLCTEGLDTCIPGGSRVPGCVASQEQHDAG